MSAGRPSLADAQLTHRQRYIIRDHQHPLGRNLVKFSGLTHRLAGEVHIGYRLHKQNPFASHLGRVGERLILQPLDWNMQPLGQLIHHHKARIVAGILILVPGVTQTYHQPLGTPRPIFTKQHIVLAPLNIQQEAELCSAPDVTCIRLCLYKEFGN